MTVMLQQRSLWLTILILVSSLVAVSTTIPLSIDPTTTVQPHIFHVLPDRPAWHDLWYYCWQLLDSYIDWSLGQLHEIVGLFTSSNMLWLYRPLIPYVYANGGTFGITTVGTSTYPSGTQSVGDNSTNHGSWANYLVAAPITLSHPGSIIKVGVNIQTAAGAMIMGFYNDAGNYPGALLATSISTTVTSGWFDLSMTTKVYSMAVKIWMVFGASNNTMNDYCYQGTGTQEYYASYTYGSLPSIFPTGGTGYSIVENMRVTYTTESLGYGSCTLVTGTVGTGSSVNFYAHNTGNFRLGIYTAAAAVTSDGFESGSLAGYWAQTKNGSSFTEGVNTDNPRTGTHEWRAQYPSSTAGSAGYYAMLLVAAVQLTATSGSITTYVADDRNGGSAGYWYKQGYFNGSQCWSIDVVSDDMAYHSETCNFSGLIVGQTYYFYVQLYEATVIGNYGQSMWVDDVSVTGGVLLGSLPNSKVWESNSTAVASAPSWQTVLISSGTPSSYTFSAINYFLCWQVDTSNAVASYAAGSAGTSAFVSLSYGSFPSSASWISGAANWSEYVLLYISITETITQGISLSVALSRTESLTRSVTQPITQNVSLSRNPQSLMRTITQPITLQKNNSGSFQFDIDDHARYPYINKPDGTSVKYGCFGISGDPNDWGAWCILSGSSVFGKPDLDGRNLTLHWLGHALSSNVYASLSGSGGYSKTLFDINTESYRTDSTIVNLSDYGGQYITLELWLSEQQYSTIDGPYIQVDMIQLSDTGSGQTYWLNHFTDSLTTWKPGYDLYGSIGYNTESDLQRTIVLTRKVTQPITVSASVSQTQFLNPGGGGGVDVPWLGFIIIGGGLVFTMLIVVWRRRR
jgi:hypothetical protein